MDPNKKINVFFLQLFRFWYSMGFFAYLGLDNDNDNENENEVSAGLVRVLRALEDQKQTLALHSAHDLSHAGWSVKNNMLDCMDKAEMLLGLGHASTASTASMAARLVEISIAVAARVEGRGGGSPFAGLLPATASTDSPAIASAIAGSPGSPSPMNDAYFSGADAASTPPDTLFATLRLVAPAAAFAYTAPLAPANLQAVVCCVAGWGLGHARKTLSPGRLDSLTYNQLVSMLMLSGAMLHRKAISPRPPAVQYPPPSRPAWRMVHCRKPGLSGGGGSGGMARAPLYTTPQPYTLPAGSRHSPASPFVCGGGGGIGKGTGTGTAHGRMGLCRRRRGSRRGCGRSLGTKHASSISPSTSTVDTDSNDDDDDDNEVVHKSKSKSKSKSKGKTCKDNKDLDDWDALSDGSSVATDSDASDLVTIDKRKADSVCSLSESESEDDSEDDSDSDSDSACGSGSESTSEAVRDDLFGWMRTVPTETGRAAKSKMADGKGKAAKSDKTKRRGSFVVVKSWQ